MRSVAAGPVCKDASFRTGLREAPTGQSRARRQRRQQQPRLTAPIDRHTIARITFRFADGDRLGIFFLPASAGAGFLLDQALGSQPPPLASHPAAERRLAEAAQWERASCRTHQHGILAVDFRSDPNLKPTEIQPPTTEQLTPAVLARKPASRVRLRHALRKGGAIALNGVMLVQNLHSHFLIKTSLLDKRISLAIAILIIFSIGVATAAVWQSSRLVASVPQAAPAPVALSPTMEQQLETMSSGLAAVHQSVNELSSGLGQMRRDITTLQTTAQAVFDKISEPPPRSAAAPPARSTPRPSQAPTPAR
jgi:hypothetical protein